MTVGSGSGGRNRLTAPQGDEIMHSVRLMRADGSLCDWLGTYDSIADAQVRASIAQTEADELGCTIVIEDITNLD